MEAKSFPVENLGIRWLSKTLPYCPGFSDQKPISKPLSLKTYMPLSLEKMVPELGSYFTSKDIRSQINLHNSYMQPLLAPHQLRLGTVAFAHSKGPWCVVWLGGGVWEGMPVLPAQVLHDETDGSPPTGTSAVHSCSAMELFLKRQEGNSPKSTERVPFFTRGLCSHYPWDLVGVWRL